MSTILSRAAVALCGLMAIFQILLSLGLPLGRMSWGGNHRVLPPKLRVASFMSAGLFVLAILTVLERADVLVVLDSPVLISVFLWLFAAVFASSTLANLASKSSIEKKIMTPVATILTVLFFIMAIQ